MSKSMCQAHNSNLKVLELKFLK